MRHAWIVAKTLGLAVLSSLLRQILAKSQLNCWKTAARWHQAWDPARNIYLRSSFASDEAGAVRSSHCGRGHFVDRVEGDDAVDAVLAEGLQQTLPLSAGIQRPEPKLEQ